LCKLGCVNLRECPPLEFRVKGKEGNNENKSKKEYTLDGTKEKVRELGVEGKVTLCASGIHFIYLMKQRKSG